MSSALNPNQYVCICVADGNQCGPHHQVNTDNALAAENMQGTPYVNPPSGTAGGSGAIANLSQNEMMKFGYNNGWVCLPAKETGLLSRLNNIATGSSGMSTAGSSGMLP